MTRHLMAAALLAALTAGSASAQQHAGKGTTNVGLAHNKKEVTYEGRTVASWATDLTSDSPLTRTVACYTLSGMGVEAKSAVPALIKALDDQVVTVRYGAAYALGEMGPAGESALEKLEKMTDDQNDDIAHIAKKSIRKIKGELPIGEPKYGPSGSR
jgi:hypothetical protein